MTTDLYSADVQIFFLFKLIDYITIFVCMLQRHHTRWNFNRYFVSQSVAIINEKKKKEGEEEKYELLFI